MDAERRVYLNEDHPLNATGATKIYLNAGKSRKVDSPNDGTVIHFNADKQTNLGVHLNTTFSIASSKKIKLLFLLNFLLSLVCMVLCFCVACYYWHELSALRRQIDTMKDHLLNQNLSPERTEVQSPLVRHQRPQDLDQREARNIAHSQDSTAEDTKKFFVEDLGSDLLFVDSKKKNKTDSVTTTSFLASVQKDMLLIQFNGAYGDRFMGNNYTIGPWLRDEDVSSKQSKDKIDLKDDEFVVNEGGVYLIYAQVTYVSHAPNTFLIWARQPHQRGRLVSFCASGDDSTQRPLKKSQISCAVQTVARLSAGDIVNLQQRDPNRTLVLKPGYSYFGFLKLA